MTKTKKITDLRPSWDEYFMQIAELASTRSTCDRLHVGAALVRDRRLVAVGYNGSPRDTKHCDEIGHRMINGHCVRTVHAEVNAVLSAALHGIKTSGSTLYTRYFPCENCVKELINAGVDKIVFREHYKNLDQPFVREILKQAKVKILKLPSARKGK